VELPVVRPLEFDGKQGALIATSDVDLPFNAVTEALSWNIIERVSGFSGTWTRDTGPY